MIFLYKLGFGTSTFPLADSDTESAKKLNKNEQLLSPKGTNLSRGIIFVHKYHKATKSKSKNFQSS